MKMNIFWIFLFIIPWIHAENEIRKYRAWGLWTFQHLFYCRGYYSKVFDLTGWNSCENKLASELIFLSVYDQSRTFPLLFWYWSFLYSSRNVLQLKKKWRILKNYLFVYLSRTGSGGGGGHQHTILQKFPRNFPFQFPFKKCPLITQM